ncbi:hypothetical protein Tco_0656553 [Tanacetum coccineum]|uniref:Uncharacterized protein n=1 Tax=Tanacetum coccineum TaxID=301880 RepID=A0ABQ4X970_9ASTR
MGSSARQMRGGLMFSFFGYNCACVADSFCSVKVWNGLSEFSQIPFDNRYESIDGRPKNLQHWALAFQIQKTVDKVDKSILSWRGRTSLVVVDWCDLKSISECVFSKIAGHVEEAGKRSEKLVCLNVLPQSCNWVCFAIFSILDAIAFSLLAPNEC